jgi:hypothetical protein
MTGKDDGRSAAVVGMAAAAVPNASTRAEQAGAFGPSHAVSPTSNTNGVPFHNNSTGDDDEAASVPDGARLRYNPTGARQDDGDDDEDGGCSSNYDDGDIDDDFSDLQRLISLARLPYCRITKVFVSGSCTIGHVPPPPTTTTATTAEFAATTRDARLLSPSQPPRGTDLTLEDEDEAASRRKRPLPRRLPDSPPAAVREPRREFRRPLRSLVVGDQRSGAVRCHHDEERALTEMEDEDDDARSGGGDATGPLPLPPPPATTGVPAAGTTPADPGAEKGPSFALSFESTIEEKNSEHGHGSDVSNLTRLEPDRDCDCDCVDDRTQSEEHLENADSPEPRVGEPAELGSTGSQCVATVDGVGLRKRSPPLQVKATIGPGERTHESNGPLDNTPCVEAPRDETVPDPASIDPSLVAAVEAAADSHRRRSDRGVLDSNDRFLAANFVRSTTGGGRPDARCRVCDRRVLSHLLRHAVTRSCLVRRVVVGRGTVPWEEAPPPAEQPLLPPCCTPEALADAAEGSRVRRAVERYWTCHSIAAAPELPPGRLCRHCHSPVLGRDFRRLFQHLVGCIGIVPLIEGLGDLLLTTLSQAFFPDLSTHRYASNAAAFPDCSRQEFAERKESQKLQLFDERRVKGLAEAGQRLPAGRTTGPIREQNLLFMSSNFVPAAALGDSVACVSCGQHRPRWTLRCALSHAITRSCLACRAERVLLLPAKDEASASTDDPRAVGGYGDHEPMRRLISNLCASLPTCPRATAAFQEYRGRHFDHPADNKDSSSNNLKCRRCSAQVHGIGHQSFLLHLAHCVGIATVVRDLESLMAGLVSSIIFETRREESS